MILTNNSKSYILVLSLLYLKGETMKDNFLLRLPKEMKEWLEKDAKKRGLTLTGLISAILSEYKKQNEYRA